jgi:hypothetical protein
MCASVKSAAESTIRVMKFVRILDELERLQAEINELEVSGGNRFRAKRSRRA